MVKGALTMEGNRGAWPVLIKTGAGTTDPATLSCVAPCHVEGRGPRKAHNYARCPT